MPSIYRFLVLILIVVSPLNLWSVDKKPNSCIEALKTNVGRIGQKWEVTFPGEENSTTIVNYGGAYIDKGKVWVDYKLWDPRYDREIKLVRPMAFSEFYNLVKINYYAYLRRQLTVVLPTHNANGAKTFKLYWVKSRPGEEFTETVELVSPHGAEITTSLEEVMRWNLDLKESEAELFQRFFSRGGRGPIYYLNPSAKNNDPTNGRFAIRVESMPLRNEPDIPLFYDKVLNQMIKEMIRDGIVVLLGHEWEDEHGEAFSSQSAYASVFEGRTGVGVLVNPTSHRFILFHEIQHLVDRLGGFKTELAASFSLVFEDHLGLFQSEDHDVFIEFVSEQRAYATQFNELLTAARMNPDEAIPIYNRDTGLSTVKVKDLITPETAYYRAVFNTHYAGPMRKLVEKIRKKNPKAAELFKYFFSMVCMPSETFSYMRLLE